MLFERVKMGFSSPGCAARDPLPGLSERPLTLMRTHGSTLALQSSILCLSSAPCPYPTADSELLLDHVAGWLHLERSAIGLRSIPSADRLTWCCAARACPAVCMSIRPWPVTLTGRIAAWV